ncbi:MAG: UDP-N-acetylglucosamine--dolichyl-phosphate N-acetylglucosaminephosphotransferase [Thermococcus sp.]|nr:UDP-N-acetylglucosamine--dolichyl-phosphate N-acetylglucosaminephosphotransferase [Thermococcus sp.]
MMWLPPLIGLTVTLILTPYIAARMKNAGIVGRDIHKPGQPEVAEMGGLALIIGIGIAGVFIEGLPEWLLPVFLLFGVLGAIDDLTSLRQLHKVILSLLVSIPLLTAKANPTVELPRLTLNLGVIYSIFAVLFVTGSANLVNMLAGFNGLEVGTSGIALLFLALLTDGPARILALTGSAGAFAFLVWNRYPARVFPGDTGTLSLGALIGLVGILGKAEFYAAILLVPHFIDFVMKATGVRFGVRKHGRTVVLEDGTLKAPPYPSLLGFIMRRIRVTEPKLVAVVWLIELLLGVTALALHLSL